MYTQYNICNGRNLFCRNPYDRLVSAYKNKNIKHPQYMKAYFQDCIKFYNRTKETIPLTFPQFIDCILPPAKKVAGASYISSYSATRLFDPHWKPQCHLSSPCLYNYTLIGEFKHFDEDMSAIIDTINWTNYTSVAKSNSSKNSSMSTSDWFKLLTPKRRKDIQTLYTCDFDMFDYDSRLP